jgi:uncharacterized membrane protein
VVAEEGNSRELDRLIFFSDAVFAIVMTLLILDIKVPDVPPEVAAQEVPGLVLELWPKFFSYVLSFLVIGLYWIAHHQTFRYVRSYDRTLLWLNLAFLLSITFVPFPTDLLGEYGELRFSVIFYAASLGMVRLLLAVVWWYVISGPIRTSADLDDRLAKFNSYRGLVVPAIFFLSIGVAFVSPNAAAASWVLLFIVDSVIWRLWRRRRLRSA